MWRQTREEVPPPNFQTCHRGKPASAKASHRKAGKCTGRWDAAVQSLPPKSAQQKVAHKLCRGGKPTKALLAECGAEPGGDPLTVTRAPCPMSKRRRVTHVHANAAVGNPTDGHRGRQMRHVHEESIHSRVSPPTWRPSRATAPWDPHRFGPG